MAQILTLFTQHTAGGSWSGKQSEQDAFQRTMQTIGLIRAGSPYHPKSGGPRTYEAQLRCLGLIFARSDKSVWLTLAGEDLVEAKAPPVRIFQVLLLKHQYPSLYGSLAQVRMHPGLRIKPFLFVLELLHLPEICRLTVEELCIPVIYGHNRRCLTLCAEKIKAMRGGKSLSDLIDSANDLYTPRTAGKSRDKRLRDIMDIANTCKNYLQATRLISVEAGLPETFEMNPEAEGAYQESVERADDFIPHPDREESFQRTYGAWDRVKDNRNLALGAVRNSIPVEQSIIGARLMQELTNKMSTSVDEEFIQELCLSYGYNEDTVHKVIERFLPKANDFVSSAFLELSVGGTATATDFEKAVCSLFHSGLHFKTIHTGQLTRRGRKGGYADGFAIALDDKHCALIDAKATSAYTLPSNDFYKMSGNYMRNYKELSDRELELEFVVYAAGGFSKTIDEQLKKLRDVANVPASAINASHLLALSRSNPDISGQERIRRIFSEGRQLQYSDFSNTRNP